MTSLMILDEARAELIAGGQFSPTLTFDLKVKQKADAKQVFSSKATASRGGENVVAACQSQVQFNNIGYAELA